MTKHVKGSLFLDYVRMLRSKKGVDWSKYLTPEDMTFMTTKIESSGWYPFDTFERMGLAILKEISNGDMQGPRLWGRALIGGMFSNHRSLIKEGDPKETLIRFQVMRQSFFDFDPINILVIFSNFAKIEINYGMSDLAEEAATWQTLGYFEWLIHLSGASNLRHRFKHMKWKGAASTILEIDWSPAPAGRRAKGSLFLEYAKMIRSVKTVDWGAYLTPEDLAVINERIEPADWYSFEIFERMAAAIYTEVADGDMGKVRLYGRQAIDRLSQTNQMLVSKDNPRETLMRFQVMGQSFFDFLPASLKNIGESEAAVKIDFGMSKLAEEVAANQLLGYLERLLELSGAKNLVHRYVSRSWEGDAETIIEFSWSDAPEKERVKGFIFLDQVKMLRSEKRVDWSRYLSASDMEYLETPIIENDWYPFDAFERIVLAVYHEIAKDMETVRKWGRYYMEGMFNLHESLIAKDDPRESLMRFQILRRSFFDFEPIIMQTLTEGLARFKILWGMSPVAEEAATWQTVGFFERLLALAGAEDIEYSFESKAWAGDRFTLLEMTWKSPVRAP